MGSRLQPHKEYIEELWLNQKLTLNELMTAMQEEKGVSASKAEYEKILRKWNFRKNFKQDLVKLARIELERRNRPSIVAFISGRKVPERTIKKCYIPESERYSVTKRHMPEEVAVIQSVAELYKSSVKTRELPWHFFMQKIEPIRNISTFVDMPGSTLRAMIPLLCEAPRYTAILMEEISHTLLEVLPIQDEDAVSRLLWNIVGYNANTATGETLKLVIYLLSNKHICEKPADDLNDELYNWFRMGNNSQLLREVVSIRMPTIDAFAEGIYGSALYAGDRAMVRIFLESKIDPDTRVRNREDFLAKTGLAVAVKQRNTALMELLCQFGADVNANQVLTEAAKTGDMQILQWLVERGASVEGNRREWAKALRRAARKGHMEMVLELLRCGADVNAQGFALDYDFNDLTPGCALTCAILSGVPGLPELLLGWGAQINPLRNEMSCGRTPLQAACFTEDGVMVQRLLALGVEVNAQPGVDGGRTALQQAAENGDRALCQTLIQAGADVNACCAWSGGQTALTAAVGSGIVEPVRFLPADRAADKERNASAAGLEDGDMGKLDLLTLLLDAGADPNAAQLDRQASPLARAASIAMRDRDVAPVRLLLSRGALPDPAAIVWATRHRNRRCLRLLLEAEEGKMQGASDLDMLLDALEITHAPTRLHQLRLMCAPGGEAHWLPLNTAQWLAVALGDWGGKFNDENLSLSVSVQTPLHMAASLQDISLVQWLLDSGAEVDESNLSGETPLAIAARKGACDIIELLLCHGADVNHLPPNKSVQRLGFPALTAAAANGHYEAVQLLLTRGADVNPELSRTSTPPLSALSEAAQNGYFRIASLLIAWGADVDAPWSDDPYDTPLASAANSGRIDMLKLLLNAGAGKRNKRRLLERAIQMARLNENEAAATMLEAHMAFA